MPAGIVQGLLSEIVPLIVSPSSSVIAGTLLEPLVVLARVKVSDWNTQPQVPPMLVEVWTKSGSVVKS